MFSKTIVSLYVCLLLLRMNRAAQLSHNRGRQWASCCFFFSSIFLGGGVDEGRVGSSPPAHCCSAPVAVCSSVLPTSTVPSSPNHHGVTYRAALDECRGKAVRRKVSGYDWGQVKRNNVTCVAGKAAMCVCVCGGGKGKGNNQNVCPLFHCSN